MGVIVPDLRKKFRLLEAYGLGASLDDIAKQLGKKPKTILWWADGSDIRQRDTVPDRSFDDLVEAFSKLLPALTCDEVRQFLLGSVAAFESYLRSGNTPSLMHFIDMEGDSSACKLIFDNDDDDMGMIEIAEIQQGKDVHVVEAGQKFRIVVEKDLRFRHVLALQHAQGLWLPLHHSIHDMDGHCLVPHVDDSGRPLFMFERHDFGRNLFVILATDGPMPSEMNKLKKLSTTLDTTMLDKLAAHYNAQPQTRRTIFSLSIDVSSP